MKFLQTLAVVAAVVADVEAIAIPAGGTSSSVSATKRRGCGRRAHTDSASSMYSTVPTLHPQSMVSSSSETTSSSQIAAYTTSSDISSATITTTLSTISPFAVTSSLETSTQTASTVSESTESTTSSTKSATQTEASTKVSSTISTFPSTTESSTTESTTEVSSTISFTLTSSEPPVTESTTEASATSSAIPTTESTTADTTPTTSTTAPTCVATNTVDGGFEDGTSTSAWTMNSLAMIEPNANNAYTTPYGSYFAVLYGQRSTTAEISQALSDVSDSSTLSFSYRIYGSMIFPTASCTLTVAYADTTINTLTFTLTNIATASAAWQTVTVPVENTASSGTLSVSWYCSSPTTVDADLALDNVYFTKATACT